MIFSDTIINEEKIMRKIAMLIFFMFLPVAALAAQVEGTVQGFNV